MSSQTFDDISKALAALGYQVVQATITQDQRHPKLYDLRIDAVGPFDPPAVKADVGTKPSVCECGAAKTGGLHSAWCPVYSPRP